MSIYFKWKIEKVIILPFGALTIFNVNLNSKIYEEFLICIMGPLFQLIFTFIFYYFTNNDVIFNYSFSILFFNLLPIFPLDGSKLLNIFFNKVTSFKQSHFLIIIISLTLILILSIYSNFNLILLLILSFLLMKIIIEIKNHESLFNKFLLERYLNNYHFKKTKIVNSLDLTKMKREYKHIFYNQNRYILEREILNKRFDFRKRMW